MKRKAITFRCEVQTPMFLGSAIKGDVEIRPPAIKGLLRFWWRAMNGHLDIRSLRQKEAQIFGSAAEHSNKSSFDVVSNEPINKSSIAVQTLFKEYDISDFDLRKNRGSDRGLAYLFYSIDLGENKKRNFILPGQTSTFSITLTSYSRETLDKVSRVFVVASLCGALGTRSRRGLGNFRIIGNHSPNFESINDFKNYLGKCLVLKDQPDQKNNDWSVLSGAKIILGRPSAGSNTWINMLDDIGCEFCDFRYAVKHKKALTPIFGLPLKHAYGTSDNEISRRSSPLIIKTIVINGLFYWMLIWLHGHFLPVNVMLNGKSGCRAHPDWILLSEFWRKISRLKNSVSIKIDSSLNDNE